MDVLELTQKYRKNILDFVKPYLSESSFIWVRNLLSDMNKRLVHIEDLSDVGHILEFYRNFVDFFNHYCDKITTTSILLTCLTAGIELNMRNINDAIVESDDFRKYIDLELWPTLKKDDLIQYDMQNATSMLLLQTNGVSDDITSGGLYTVHYVTLILKNNIDVD